MDKMRNEAASPTRKLEAALSAIAESAGERSSFPELLDAIAQGPTTALGLDFGVLLLADEARQELEVSATHGLPPEYRARFAERTPVRLGSGVFGGGPSSRAYQTLESIAIVDCREDPSVEQWLTVTEEFGIGGMLTTPIHFDGQARGTLNCFTREPHVFSEAEIATVATLAQQAALALEIARVRQDDIAQLRKLQRAHEELAVRTESLRKSESIHERLRQLLLNGGRLSTIAETLADALGGKILIIDPDFEALAHSYVSDSVALSEVAELARSERLAYLIDAAIAKRSSTSAKDAAVSAHGTVSIVPVYLMGEYVASILALGIDVGSGGFERPALENASTLVALELLKQRQRDREEAQARGNLVRYLLDGQFRDDDELVAVMNDADYDFRRFHRAVVVRTRAVAAGPEEITGEHRRRIEKRMAKSLRSKGLAALSDVVNNTVVVFAPADVPLESLVAAIRGAHATSGDAPGLESRIGVGRTTRGIAGLQRSHAEAARCAMLAERLNSVAPIDIEQFGIFGLLLATSELEDLYKFASDRLAPLREHRPLQAFLRDFFDADGRLQQIAESSHIHVNTVKYRLRRVGEVLGVDMRSTDTLMELRLALMISDLRATGPEPPVAAL